MAIVITSKAVGTIIVARNAETKYIAIPEHFLRDCNEKERAAARRLEKFRNEIGMGWLNEDPSHSARWRFAECARTWGL